MTKQYQRTSTPASETRPGVPKAVPVVPEQVTVAMAEIAADLREGLLALVVGAGLQVMQSLTEADAANWVEGGVREYWAWPGWRPGR